MSEKLPIDCFEWVDDISKIDENFVKKYYENSNVGYFIKADIEYLKELHILHSDLSFLPERMKVNKSKKLICYFCDKKYYVDHIRLIKKTLNNGLKTKKFQKVLKFNQNAWLKGYIDMNTGLIKDTKNDFEKDHYKLMNNAVFGKNYGKCKKT